jgi:hypothetical protein
MTRAMPKPNKQSVVSAVLRESLREHLEHLYTVATGSGVGYANLWRFLFHDRELTQREIDSLTAYLGLRLVAVKRKVKSDQPL